MHLQFISTLEANVEALTGSPVKVTIDSVTSGSVVVTETYAFLDNSVTSAANLATVLTSSDSLIGVWDNICASDCCCRLSQDRDCGQPLW